MKLESVPVGTLVTGTPELALHTHANFLTWASIALHALLTGAWLTAVTATANGSLNGRLFLPAPTPELRPAPATSRSRQCSSSEVVRR
jgi:hypothetical protein